MRADVQKPIQSLHSFGRHCFRGRCAAIPLKHFQLQTIGTGLLVIMMLVALASAQPQDTNPQEKGEKRLDVLFDRIMQSMPNEVRAQVDSAGSVAVERKKVTDAISDVEKQRLSDKNGTDAKTRVLPDDLKAQVERAIVEMRERKEERKAQFRESRHHK